MVLITSTRKDGYTVIAIPEALEEIYWMHINIILFAVKMCFGERIGSFYFRQNANFCVAKDCILKYQVPVGAVTFDESKQYAFRAHIIYSVSLFGF